MKDTIMASEADRAAFGRVISASQINGSSRRGALAQLSEISEKAEALSISNADIMDALGAPHDLLSISGPYYKLQAISLRYLRTPMTTLVFVVGVAATISFLSKKAAQAIRALVWCASLLAAIVPGAPDVKWMLAILGQGDDKDVRDGESALSGLVSLIPVVLPGPIGLLVNYLSSNLFGGDALSTASAAPNSVQTASYNNSASSSLLPVAQTAVSPATGIITAGIGALADNVWDLVSGIFSDGEVRDGETERSVKQRAAALLTQGYSVAQAADVIRNECQKDTSSYAEIVRQGTTAW